MSPSLESSLNSLDRANALFKERKLSSIAHADARGAALAAGLQALAAEFGVLLQTPLHIDSRGEFSIVAIPPDGRPLSLGCGPFGDFAKVLNGHAPRTGQSPGATLTAESGWCRMGHFEVERLLLSRRAATPTVDAPATSPKPRRARP